MEKDYCPNCCINTNHSILFKKHNSSTYEEYFDWSMDYEVLQCNGCDNIQFRTNYSNETMISYDYEAQDQVQQYDKKYYPKSITEHIKLKDIYEIPDKIRVVYNETLEALRNNCYLLSAVGLRAIIEAVCIEQNIVARNLEKKINMLADKRLITKKDSDRLHSIRFLGNDSVHEMAVPKEQKIRIALGIVENLMNSLYLLDVDAKQHLDTMITEFEDFKNLLLRKFKTIQSNEEKSLKEVFGKDFRRIEGSYLVNFTQQVIDDINSNLISAILVGQIKVSSIENSPVQHFVKNSTSE